MSIEKFTREYCKTHNIRYRIRANGDLETYSPITRGFSSVCNITSKTENEVRIDIERHIAIFLH